MATSLITGVTGQTGSYLADSLLMQGERVIGMSRRRSGGGDWRVEHLKDNHNFVLDYGDITDSGSIIRLIEKYKPDYFYNCAAQSYVGLSWSQPVHTQLATDLGVTNCLEALRLARPECRFLQCSSSEMFGRVQETPQTENTPFYPRSPYGVAKLAGYWMTRVYRESYGMFACNMIGFNHEGPRRGIEFVTRKICSAAAQIAKAGGGTVSLGNLDSKRDWSHAKDFVRGMQLIIEHAEPDDFILSSDETHSIREFLELAFGHVGLNWKDHVVQDPALIRPAEVDLLLGDSSKARKILGWLPLYSFKGLVEDMMEAELKRLS